MIGRTVGKYRIVERLGRGGMGTVYKAVDETLDREVAIKVLNADLQDAELLKRFRAEAVTLARLNHPGIATLYELYRDDSDLLMVMEYVRGETLHDLAERVGALAPPQAAHVAIQILDALAHAHRWGVVHRDLKPANLMVTDAGAIKVMDFGIARVLGTEHFTQGGYMMGTPAYMAPEQVLGGEIDGRSDLYAVGVVLYRLLSGQLPFSADTAIAMVQKQVNEAPTPISVFQPDLPAWCAGVLERALAKAPEERFQAADEFRAALHGAHPVALGEMPTIATPTPTSLRNPRPATPSPHALSTTAGHTQPEDAGATRLAPTPASGATPPPATPRPALTPQAPPAPRPDHSTTTLVLGRKQLFALSGLGVAVILGIVVLAFLALRRPTFPQELQIGAVPPSEAQPSDQAAADQTATSEPSGEADGQPAANPPTPPASASEPAATAPAAPAAKAPPAGTVATGRSGAASPPANAPASPVTPSTPGREGEPPAAAATPAPAATNEAGAVSFTNVRLLMLDDGRAREIEGTLRLGDGRVTVLSKDGATALTTLPYSALTGTAYSRAKQPRWTEPDGSEGSTRVDLGRFGFMRSERNWLIFLSHRDPVIVRVEDGALRTVLPAIEERTGLRIQR